MISSTGKLARVAAPQRGRRIAWTLGESWRGRWPGLIGLHLPPLASSACFITNNAA